MRQPISPGTLCVVAIALSALSGCAFLKGSGAGSAFVEADRQHLLLPGSSSTPARAIAHRSPYEYQEYVRSATNGQAEAIFLDARTAHTAIDIENRDLASLNARWRHNEAGAVQWHNTYNTHLSRSQIEYRRYGLRRADSRTVQDCVAFIRTWDTAAGDPLLRPRRAYFGYYCPARGEALPDNTLDTYLRRIRIMDQPMTDFTLGSAVPRDETAATTARGAGQADRGIRSFPLNLVRQFPIGAGYSSGK